MGLIYSVPFFIVSFMILSELKATNAQTVILIMAQAKNTK